MDLKMLKKKKIGILMKLVFENGFKSENSIVGFKTAGLFPLSFDAISEKLSLGTAFLQSTPSTPSTPLTPYSPSTPSVNNKQYHRLKKHQVKH